MKSVKQRTGSYDGVSGVKDSNVNEAGHVYVALEADRRRFVALTKNLLRGLSKYMEELTDKASETDDLRKCRRCLLYETADKAAYESVRSYIASMRDEDRASEEVYGKRLKICRECDFLLAGMCRKCGCYAEVRAAGVKSTCPGGQW